jgi:hypothetical protein
MIDDGHLFMVTRPKETAAMIEAFLSFEGELLMRSRAASTAASLPDELVGRGEALAKKK